MYAVEYYPKLYKIKGFFKKCTCFRSTELDQAARNIRYTFQLSASFKLAYLCICIYSTVLYHYIFWKVRYHIHYFWKSTLIFYQASSVGPTSFQLRRNSSSLVMVFEIMGRKAQRKIAISSANVPLGA